MMDDFGIGSPKSLFKNEGFLQNIRLKIFKIDIHYSMPTNCIKNIL
jgi:hypothetical protein